MWTTILTASASGLLGAILGAAASFYALRQKVSDMDDRIKGLEAQVVD